MIYRSLGVNAVKLRSEIGTEDNWSSYFDKVFSLSSSIGGTGIYESLVLVLILRVRVDGLG